MVIAVVADLLGIVTGLKRKSAASDALPFGIFSEPRMLVTGSGEVDRVVDRSRCG